MIKSIILVISLNQIAINGQHANLGNYPDLTMNECGIADKNLVVSRCFKWHKTGKQELKSKQMGNIMGGAKARLGEFPWMTRINVKCGENVGTCGGAILNEHWVITAAHCLIHPIDRVLCNQIVLTVGHVNVNDTGLRYTASSKNFYVFSNKSFTSTAFDDIGLIKVNKRIEQKLSVDNIYTVNGVCLPKINDLNKHEENATFSGWGRTGPSKLDKKAQFLMKLTVSIYPYNAFSGLMSRFDHQIDGVANERDQPCSGDSGSPLVQEVFGRAILIGIYKGKHMEMYDLSNKCPPRRPIFTRVSKYIDWIHRVINNN